MTASGVKVKIYETVRPKLPIIINSHLPFLLLLPGDVDDVTEIGDVGGEDDLQTVDE